MSEHAQDSSRQQNRIGPMLPHSPDEEHRASTPLELFFFWNVNLSIGLSIIVAALTLGSVGAYKARVTVGKPFRSGMEMAIIGTVSALAGYVVGLIFKVPTVP